jgi:hypothetical protein
MAIECENFKFSCVCNLRGREKIKSLLFVKALKVEIKRSFFEDLFIAEKKHRLAVADELDCLGCLAKEECLKK